MIKIILFMMTICFPFFAIADDSNVQVDTTRIKANKELPKVLYVVPWKDMEKNNTASDQKLVLHDFFGDLYDPVLPSSTLQKTEKNISQSELINNK